jgi:hypothetical protein
MAYAVGNTPPTSTPNAEPTTKAIRQNAAKVSPTPNMPLKAGTENCWMPMVLADISAK